MQPRVGRLGDLPWVNGETRNFYPERVVPNARVDPTLSGLCEDVSVSAPQGSGCAATLG